MSTNTPKPPSAKEEARILTEQHAQASTEAARIATLEARLAQIIDIDEGDVESKEDVAKEPQKVEAPVIPDSDIQRANSNDDELLQHDIAALKSLSREHQKTENALSSSWFNGDPESGAEAGRARYISLRRTLGDSLTRIGNATHWQDQLRGKARELYRDLNSTIAENGDFSGGHASITSLIRDIRSFKDEVAASRRQAQERLESANTEPEANDVTEENRPSVAEEYASFANDLRTALQSVCANPFWNREDLRVSNNNIAERATLLMQHARTIRPSKGARRGTIETLSVESVFEELQALHDDMEIQLQAHPSPNQEASKTLKENVADILSASTERISTATRWALAMALGSERARKITGATVVGTAALLGAWKMASYNPAVDDVHFDDTVATAKDDTPPSNLPPATQSPNVVFSDTVVNATLNSTVHRDGNNLVLSLPAQPTQIRFGAPKQPIVRQMMQVGGQQTIAIPADALQAEYLSFALDVFDPATQTWTEGSFVKVPLK